TFESCGVTVQKNKLRATAMQVCMDVILLRNSCQLAVIEQPNYARRMSDRAKSNLITRTGPINVLVQAIMEQVVSITAAGIGRTNPERSPGIDGSVSAPGHFSISRHSEHPRQVHVPAFIRRTVRRAILG